MREELNAYLLALVLTAVLVWYTHVSPSYAPARVSRPQAPDAEERGSGGGASAPDELDWPEYLEEV